MIIINLVSQTRVKVAWLLMCPKESIKDPETMFAQINDADEMIRMEFVRRGTTDYCHNSAIEFSPLLWAGRACERYGLYEQGTSWLILCTRLCSWSAVRKHACWWRKIWRACDPIAFRAGYFSLSLTVPFVHTTYSTGTKGLTYLDKVEELSNDTDKYLGGRPAIIWQRSMSRSCAGRIFAKLGRMEEAALKFEGAIADARGHKYKVCGRCFTDVVIFSLAIVEEQVSTPVVEELASTSCHTSRGGAVDRFS
jgi:hypothetical protein